MTNDHFYLETPLPYIQTSPVWLETLKQGINDAPFSSLTQGYYDENSHVVVLSGHRFATKSPATAAYLSPNNFSTGHIFDARPPITAASFNPNNFSTGNIPAAQPSATTGYLSSENFSTGLDIVNNSMNVISNVTGSTAATTAGCCIIL